MPVLEKGRNKYQDFYREKVDALRVESDAYFGVESRRYFDSDSGHDVWVRDASMVDDSKLEKSHSAPLIQKNNALLRCLARLRAVDYVISQTDTPVFDATKRDAMQVALQEAFERLENEVNNKADYLEQEKKFNTLLIRKLYEANLTEGCLTAKEAENLLAHYRTLSSVLDPAMPLVTLTYDKESQLLQREVQYPVTTKTEAQKKEIEKFKAQGVVAHPVGPEINSHTVHSVATQRADACFWDMLADDKRMLSAQARKTHLVGVKNAFVVSVDTEFCDWQQENSESFRAYPLENIGRRKALLGSFSSTNHSKFKDPRLTFIRMGVPVFVGGGETEERLNQATAENLEQIQMAAKKHLGEGASEAMHLTVLNTDSKDKDKQDVMLQSLRHEIANNDRNPHQMSNVPTNDYGTAFASASLCLDIRNAYKQRKGQAWLGWMPGQKASRLKIAVDAFLAGITSGFLSCVNCASGQDRTGTVVEKAIQQVTFEKWMEFFMGAKKRAPTQEEEVAQMARIQKMRARGFNAAEIASHMVPGSPGLKECSEANNWFDSARTFMKVLTKTIYLKSADTNKSNKVGSVLFLKKPPDVARDEFNRCRHEFERALAELTYGESFSENLKAAGTALLKEFGEFESPGASLSLFEQANKMRRDISDYVWGTSGRRNARDLADMTEALRYACDTVKGLHSGGGQEIEKAEQSIMRLQALEQVLPGHADLKRKIAAFAITATVVLIVAAMFAFPPFGAAVLATAAMVAALSQMIAAAAALSTAGVLFYGLQGTLTGAWGMWSGSYATGKAKALEDFRMVSEEKKQQASNDGESQEQDSSSPTIT